MNGQRNTDERLLAALAHGSIVANGLGIVLGLVIWLGQREKSAYAAGQGLQAAVYQLVGLVVLAGLWVAWGIFYAVSMIPIVRQAEQYSDAPPPLFWVALASTLVPLGMMILWGLYGLWGAWQTWRGKPFRYALLGRWLRLA